MGPQRWRVTVEGQVPDPSTRTYYQSHEVTGIGAVSGGMLLITAPPLGRLVLSRDGT